MTIDKELRPAMMILPGGTGCNLVRSLHLDVKKTLGALDHGIIVPCDVIKLIHGPEQNTLYMFHVCCWGLPTDATLVAENFRWAGAKRYVLGSLWTILRRKPRSANIYIDGIKCDVDSDVVFIVNNQHVGDDFWVAPFAKLNDGLMGIFLCCNGSNLNRLGDV
jgi:diacylglycerol kinase family enzyme